MEIVEQLLRDILGGIVSQPESIDLNISEDTDDVGEMTVINVKLAKDDFGVCIGQKGTTAEAIRRVVGLVAHRRLGKRVYVKIDAPKIPKNHYYQEDAPVR